jgi:arginine:ornithine antiporter/lysine permease
MEPVVGYWGTAFISVGVIVSVLGGLATFYTVFLVFAAGLDFTLLSFIIYAPGTVLFVMSRREQNRRVFSRPELIILVIAVAGAVAGIAALATGAISI